MDRISYYWRVVQAAKRITPPPCRRNHQAEEFRSWEIIRPILEGYETLPELLAAKSPDYSPPGFWERFEDETHATREGPCGQLAEAVQVRAVGGGEREAGLESRSQAGRDRRGGFDVYLRLEALAPLG